MFVSCLGWDGWGWHTQYCESVCMLPFSTRQAIGRAGWPIVLLCAPFSFCFPRCYHYLCILFTGGGEKTLMRYHLWRTIRIMKYYWFANNCYESEYFMMKWHVLIRCWFISWGGREWLTLENGCWGKILLLYSWGTISKIRVRLWRV
jgi:hypothetical protein